MSALDILPPVQRETAHAALREVIGTAAIDAITPISGGATSARLFRIDAGGENFLLRIEGVPSPLRNPYQYASLRIASEAGIAPRLYYANEMSRVAVMDFVQRRPLGRYPGGPPALAKALGELLARLQATPPFPAFVGYPEIVARLWAHVCRTGLFAPGVLDRCNDHLERIRAAYIWDEANSVSSHNDSLPANILFDGNRLWMIDWESAYRTDPLVDLAIVGDSFARTPELEEILHRAWLGRPLDEPLRARLRLVRALTRLYYVGVLFSASATAPRAAPDTSLAAPTLTELAAAARAGRVRIDTPAAKHVLGKMFLASFLADVATPGFDLSV
ncbi:phosphotransferase [Bradyrhizobium sp. Pha-3]|uniref:phosphotransferase n=1 Tax=Bradyrhizobium sp. Pha-3 TaxID=208375 RepID=UPI0035D4C74C